MAARPAVIPETFSGEGSFSEWCDHFDSVAEVNGWDAAAKALWLRVRLVGRAQTAFKRLSAEDSAEYSKAIPRLRERFEPASKSALYAAEFQNRRKRPTEDWAAFGEDLKTLVDKAYPQLEEAARECLAVNHFLGQLDSQLAFSVRQAKPKTMNAAVTATLEMESYRMAPHAPSSTEQEPATFVDAVHPRQDAMMGILHQLMTRVDKLEKEIQACRAACEAAEHRQPPNKPPSGPVVCRRCGKEGHYSRGCAAPRRPAQGND